MGFQIPTFREFLKEHFKDYQIDTSCSDLVKKLGQYAFQSEGFQTKVPANWLVDDIQTELSLEKGILIYGPVGSGKTEIIRMFNRYLLWLRKIGTTELNATEPFFERPVWVYAPKYSNKESGGDEAMREICQRTNIFFDELCLTNEKTGVPDREFASFFGNKIFVGEEIIRIRHSIFYDTMGKVKTIFTTNESPKRLKQIYGERAFSRLCFMCNMIPYTGKDRRINSKPVFMACTTKYTPLDEKAAVEKELDVNHFKKIINGKYKTFLSAQTTQHIDSFDYTVMKWAGMTVPSEEDVLNKFYNKVTSARIKNAEAGIVDGERNITAAKIVKQVYASEEELPYAERDYVSNKAKILFVASAFYAAAEKKCEYLVE